MTELTINMVYINPLIEPKTCKFEIAIIANI
jgi:hypothetical protein